MNLSPAEPIHNGRPSSSARKFATIRGWLDDEPSTAVVWTDGTIEANPGLLDRASQLVELGESFDDGRLTASLTGAPLVAALTLVRSYDHVTGLEMSAHPTGD